MVSVSVSLNKNNSGAGELTDKYRLLLALSEVVIVPIIEPRRTFVHYRQEIG